MTTMEQTCHPGVDRMQGRVYGTYMNDSSLSPKGPAIMSDSFRASVAGSDVRTLVKLAKQAKMRSAHIPQVAYVSASDGAVSVSVTDFDLTISATMPAQVVTSGGMFVDAAWLFANAPKGRGDVAIVGNAASWSIVNGLTATGPAASSKVNQPFERLLPVTDGETVALPSSFLSQLATILISASTDLARPALTAVFIDEGALAATDSYRLSVVNHGVNLGPLTGLIIPRNLCEAALSIGATSAIVSADRRRVSFYGPSGVVTGSPYEGTFPKYGSLRSDKNDLSLSIVFDDVKKTVEALRTMATAAKRSKSAAPVKISSGSGFVILECTIDGNMIRAEVPGSADLGSEETAAFRPKYLGEMLSTMPTDRSATVRGVSTLKPFETSQYDGECSEHWQLIMPVRIP